MSPLPPGVKLCCRGNRFTLGRHRVGIFIFTLLIYTTFHIARKPISVVKPVLHPNCSEIARKENRTITPQNATFCMWKPFDTINYNVIFGYLDLAYLLAYAVGMFICGHIAERMNLRIFLTLGCLLSGITTALFGCGYFFQIHALPFYILTQIVAGFVQSSGWPAVVTCMGNWFGKERRGLILGVWNSHVSLGNILGSLLAGAFVEIAWGWSFVVPGLVIGGMGLVVFFFLIPHPEDISADTSVGAEIKDGGSTSRQTGDSERYPLLRESPSFASTVATETGEENLPVAQEDTVAVSFSGALAVPDGGSTSRQTGDSERYPLLRESPSFASTVAAETGEENLPVAQEDTVAISFSGALAVPGVVQYSLCLFFVKLVAYTFLFWLPKYIREANGFEAKMAATLSTAFDIGGIAGGILAGLISDRASCNATICLLMISLSVPILFAYYLWGALSVALSIGMLFVLGVLIVGPYALITTVISTDLGTDQSLDGNAKALATVVAIIDGTGSLGAAIGPYLVGLVVDYGWLYIFLMLMGSLSASLLFLLRRVVQELRGRCLPTVQYVLPPQ